MADHLRRHRAWLWLGVGAVLAVAIVWSPVVTVVSYGDAPSGSVTLTEMRSAIGLPTSLALWLAVTAVAVAATVVAAWMASLPRTRRSLRRRAR